ncbi:hypothetical protein M9H77_08189 [Catharanthus roseus]|uniref:Uncharacterized protein n=1 Tax=Catharanthus roseus TaxID=4058 RepID=A0ACC0BX13_CATRO|nr:hypothetical protein M9H77_08189 [Catharanthus roseus]
MNEGQRGGSESRQHTGSSISFTEHQLKRQADLTKSFSKRRHLGELHKHHTRDKRSFEKFHEARQKAEEEVSTTGTPMPDDLQLMATISGELSLDQLYEVGSETAYLRAESNRA